MIGAQKNKLNKRSATVKQNIVCNRWMLISHYLQTIYFHQSSKHLMNIAVKFLFRKSTRITPVLSLENVF